MNSQVKSLKKVCNSFSNVLNTFAHEINSKYSMLKDITFTYNDLSKLFGNTIVNEKETVSLSDLLQYFANNIVALSQSTANELINIFTQNDIKQFTTSNSMKDKFNEYTNYLSKVKYFLEKKIFYKIKKDNNKVFNEFKSLLKPVISEFYRLKAKCDISILHKELEHLRFVNFLIE